ncbi:MAG: hypothetical protein EA364_15985 [Balneolaceae bacterium]|jgi:hypothetical protein|nr:MAG: hypothetical protein EA364_15985 [Balneolaceae bacterium]
MKKLIIGLLVVVPLLLFGLVLLFLTSLDENDIQQAAANAMGPDYSVEIGSANVSPFSREIRMGHISVSSASSGHLIFEADTLILSGIGLTGLIRNRITLMVLKMENFTIDWDDDLVAAGEGGKDGDSRLKKLALRNIDLINGNIILREGGRIKTRYNEVNLTGSFDTGLIPDTGAAGNRNASIHIGSIGFLLSGDRYRFALNDFDYSQNTGQLSLASLKLIPVGGYDQYMASLEYRTDMFEVEIENLTIAGIDDIAFLEDNTIKAGFVDIGMFNIHVSSNLQLPKDPEKAPPGLLNEKIQGLPYHLQLESILVHKANVRYSEQAGDGARTGTVSFNNSTVKIRDVNSRTNEPAVLVAATYLQNHSELNTELRFSLGDGPFALTGTGSLNPFDAKQLNSIFMDVAGIEITDGTVHELTFRLAISGNKSAGQMHLVYEDLKLKTIDKDDYRGGLRRSIFSLLANEVAIRSNNMPNSDGSVKEGVIEHERDTEQDSFFKFLWQSLRSGLLDIVVRF